MVKVVFDLALIEDVALCGFLGLCGQHPSHSMPLLALVGEAFAAERTRRRRGGDVEAATTIDLPLAEASDAEVVQLGQTAASVQSPLLQRRHVFVASFFDLLQSHATAELDRRATTWN